MEATTKEIRQVRQMIMEGTNHETIAKTMGITAHRVNGIISKMRANDIDIKFQVSIEEVQKTHRKLFEAIDNYHANPTLCNLDRMNNLQAIDRRTFAY